MKNEIDLAIKLSKFIHDYCENGVLHDVGLKLLEIIREHEKENQ